ncbi:BON domain-containing protein [Hydrogenophaga sp. PAMC20947]|uniref:BON domain-containing protein n=1 Tax=Hydrogenophaga sp. PAMC20947 TaxID=2565558 RepID=UPI00109DD496|nr:BON domain-containing protein [Hydrogenophaga sp. PAMC20947]QCB46886.1 BON domain-containing protein [Hydrogenophaga sp. PAMC20947]
MNSHPHRRFRFRYWLTAVAVLALLAWSKADERTVGQQIESTVATFGQKADEARVDIRREMAQATSDTTAATQKLTSKLESATDKVASKVQDTAITVRVKAELAKDDQLAALKIDVDTRRGAVKLLGTTPDASARERADRLTASVQGVISVDNQLVVRA